MYKMACAAGGPILLDFSDKENISCEKIAFSFEDMGYRLVIVNTGKGHADLSEEYSSIPMEMREAAKAMGVDLLCESNMENLLAHVKDIPNDRAVLRAMHFLSLIHITVLVFAGCPLMPTTAVVQLPGTLSRITSERDFYVFSKNPEILPGSGCRTVILSRTARSRRSH